MRVVFVGDLNAPYVSTTQMRSEALRDLGHEVTGVCSYKCISWGGRVMGAPFRRLKWGPAVCEFNSEVLEAVRSVRPALVWVDNGLFLARRTLEKIKENANCTLIHYTPDPAIVLHRSRHFLSSIPLYDIVITNKSYEVPLYRQRGARRILLRPPTFDLTVHKPEILNEEEKVRYSCDVVFTGTYRLGREKYLRPIVESGVDLAIWGSYWRERCDDRLLRPHIRGGGLAGREYSMSICGAKIGLGLLERALPDQVTTRSIEIPACGVFMLAQRTEEHLNLFEEGREAEFFGSETELLSKLTYYLTHEAERDRIAKAGRDRCLRSGYSNHASIEDILGIAAVLIEGRRAF